MDRLAAQGTLCVGRGRDQPGRSSSARLAIAGMMMAVALSGALLTPAMARNVILHSAPPAVASLAPTVPTQSDGTANDDRAEPQVASQSNATKVARVEGSFAF